MAQHLPEARLLRIVRNLDGGGRSRVDVADDALDRPLRAAGRDQLDRRADRRVLEQAAVDRPPLLALEAGEAGGVAHDRERPEGSGERGGGARRRGESLRRVVAPPPKPKRRAVFGRVDGRAPRVDESALRPVHVRRLDVEQHRAGRTGGRGREAQVVLARPRVPRHRVESLEQRAVEEVAVHDRRRLRHRGRLEEPREVAQVEPARTQEVGVQAAAVRDDRGEERAVDPARARAGEDVDDEQAVEGLRHGVVDAPLHTALLLDAGPGAPGAVELDRDTAHPDGEADAAVPAHRQPNLLRPRPDRRRRGGGWGGRRGYGHLRSLRRPADVAPQRLRRPREC